MATTAEQNQEPQKQLQYLRRYLVLNPGDAAAMAELGLVQASLAERGEERIEALLILQDANRSNPNLPLSVREECVRLALHPTVNLLTVAKQELDILLQLRPNAAQYEEWYGDLHVRESDYSAANKLYEAALTHNPHRHLAFGKLAWLRRKNFNRPTEGDNIIGQLVNQNANSAAAHLVAADYWRASDQGGKADKEVGLAQKLAPADPHVLLAVAERAASAAARGKGDDRKAADQEAVRLLTQLIEGAAAKLPAKPVADPEREEARLVETVKQAYQLLIRLHVQAKRTAPAVEVARKFVERFPTEASGRLTLIDALVSDRKFEEAERLIADLDARAFPPTLLDYHRGRIAIAREEWATAARALERATDGLATTPGLFRQANLMLADCYRQSGELDRRYEAFRRAIPADLRDPLWVVAVAGTAETLADMGRVTDAIGEYQRLAAGFREFNAPLARLLVLQTLRLPADRRDWSRVEAVADQVPAGPDADLARAEITAGKADLAAAAKSLDEALAKAPTSFPLWTARVGLAVRAKDQPLARQLVAAAEQKFPNAVGVPLLKLRLLVGDGEPPPDPLRALVADAGRFPPADAKVILTELAAVAERFEKTRPVARECLARLAEKFPNDLGVLYQRFDQAVQDKDFPAVADLAARVRQLAGADSVPDRVARAFQLLARAEGGDATELADATRLLQGLEQQRPGWQRLQVALGRTAELRGDKLEAARRYRRALELGDAPPAVVNRLLELYYETRQYAEADAVLRNAAVPTATAPPALLAELSLGAKEYGKAAEYAARAVPADATDVDRLLWKARMLVLAGNTAEAEKTLARTTELAPDRPEGWTTLAQLLASTNRRERIAALLPDAAKKVRPADALLVTAQYKELLGRPAEAAADYEALLKARADVPALRAAGSFYLRVGNREQARKLFERIIASTAKSQDDEIAVRRLLAITLADRHDPKDSQRALEVLGLATVDAAAKLTGQESVEDLRTRVVVLLGLRGRRPKAAALNLMEAVEARTALTPEDHYLFGRVSWALGDRTRALTRLRLAAQAAGASVPSQVTLFDALVQMDDAEGAKRVAEPLIRRDPDAPLALELNARLAMAAGRKDEAVALARRWAAAVGKAEAAGQLLERGGLADEAEPIYRPAAEGGKLPDRLTYVLYLSRTGRAAPAVAEFERCTAQFLAKDFPPAASIPLACQIAFQNSTAPPELLAKLARHVDTAAADRPDLAVYRAAMKSLLGDYASSVSISQAVLRADPKNALALNNLAYLLSLKDGRHDEALGLIRRALDAAPSSPELIDTEAVILLAKGDNDAAIERLTDLTTDQPSAVIWFHLAQAYATADRMPDARAAFKEATRLRLREADFHPLEHATVRTFRVNILSN